MPRFVIERNYAEALQVSAEDALKIVDINDAADVKWIVSFLSADKRKTYCIYEAANPEAIRVAARNAGLPADVIIELDSEIRPEMFA